MVLWTEETTSIVCPPRDTSSLQTQATRYLATEGLPVVAHIAAPQGRAVTLDTGKTATGQYHGLLTGLYQTLVNGLVYHQRINVAHLLASPFAAIHPATCQIVVLGLGSILPPGIYTQRHQALLKVLPVGSSCLGVKEVNPVGSRYIVVGSTYLLAYFRALVNLRPYRYHQADIHLVQTVGQRFWIGIEILVELHRVPTVLAPILPILHNHTDRQLLTAEPVGRLQYLVRRVETLSAVDIAQSPLRHQRTLTRQLAISGYNLVRRANKHGVVDGIGHWRTERCLIVHLIIIKHRLIVLG